MSIAVIDTPDNYHQLDHLIIFCDFFNAKLFIQDTEHKKICEKYYPKFQLEEIFTLDHAKKEIGENYAYLIHSFFWPKELFRNYFQNYKIKSIFTPHGNSDKHSKANWMTRFKDQEFCLLYGNHMLDFLKEEKVVLKNYAFMGNLRYRYYLKHQKYFQKNHENPFRTKMNPEKKTILYAPTKKDKSMLSSFDSNNHFFFEKLADEFNLIIKLHPHFVINYPEIVYPFYEKISSKAYIVDETPLIYPLLNLCDALITDYSSIGYDFLTFNRPLFFLQTDKKDLRSTTLHNCGVILDKNDYNFVEIIKNKLKYDIFSKQRKKLYQYAFYSKFDSSKVFEPPFSGGNTKTAIRS